MRPDKRVGPGFLSETVMERVVATVSVGGVPVAARVEAWVRNYTGGNGTVGWEGRFEADGASIEPGEYEFATTDGRTGRIRVTHIGVSSRHPTRVEFTGAGLFGLVSM